MKMTTSKQKATGSAAERAVAQRLQGVRVGQAGGPVDVIVPGYCNVQVKKVKTMPSMVAMLAMIDRMPDDVLRAVVIIPREGPGKKARATITFELGAWAEWHGNGTLG